MASKLHQLIKAIVTKTDKLVSIFCPYSVEEENLLPQVFLWPLYVCHDICVNVYTYTNNKLIHVIELKKKEVAEMKRRAAVRNLRNEGLWWNMVYIHWTQNYDKGSWVWSTKARDGDGAGESFRSPWWKLDWMKMSYLAWICKWSHRSQKPSEAAWLLRSSFLISH